MNSNSRLRYKRIAGWIVFFVFALGLFLPLVGDFTGLVLGVWFVGTQRIRRGFVWMVIFGLLFGGFGIVHGAIHAESGAPGYIGWALLLLVAGVLPFTLHRITNPHLPSFAATLPFPVYSVLLVAFQASLLNAHSATLPAVHSPVLLRYTAAILGPAGTAFFLCWFASTLVWAWNQEFRATHIWMGMATPIVACAVATGIGAFTKAQSYTPGRLMRGEVFIVLCLAAGIGFIVWAIVGSLRRQGWYCRPETLRILRSPVTAQALRLEGAGRTQALISRAGERFSFRYDIPDLRRPDDLAGDNGKYNVLYETIGGFYDHIQRVVCALQGFDRDAYVKSYMDLLEVEPGNSVLETSVGTGLNFRYLPLQVRLTGLDLSPEMLLHCRANLRRWGLEADLFLGNAESLPFADESFDVVFHVGGINFFNDRAKAIREMIRVAKPGSLILIADETEEHVKDLYERGPLTSRFFKNRREPVTPPVDLVPPEMLDKRLLTMKPMGKNRFYALTFRKPATVSPQLAFELKTSLGTQVVSQ